MGTYVYKITRKARKISGVKIHMAEFVYKCGGSMFDTDSKGRTRDERCHARYVEPTARAWAKAEIMKGESIKDALFVEEYEDGATVMRRSSVSFYDGGEFGEAVGRLYMNGENGRFRYVPNKPESYKVTFEKIGCGEPVSEYVMAINETRAKTAAINKIDAQNKVLGVYHRTIQTVRGVKIVRENAPMTKDEAITLAMEALRKSNGPLSDRVKARNILKEMRA